MQNLDFPSNYKSEITATKEFNIEKCKLQLLGQQENLITIKFNYSIFPLYKGNSVSLTDNLSNTYFGFIESINTNSETASVVICHDSKTPPIIVKVEYYEWWTNKRPAATILNYIFINEDNG